MDLTSIDNCYEDDGLLLAQNFLAGLNIEAIQSPNDPLRRVLVAVIPELRADGRLDRLNFLTCPAEDPGALTEAELTLMTAAAAIVAARKVAHAKAIAALTVPTVAPLPTEEDPRG